MIGTNLTKEDKTALFTARWLTSEIKKLSTLEGTSETIRDYAEDLSDILTEVLDEDTPTHTDKDRTPKAETALIDEIKNHGKTNFIDEKYLSDSRICRLYVAIGHNKGTGAVSHDGIDEWESSLLVGEKMLELAPEYGIQVKLGIRDRSLSYGSAMRKHGKEADYFGANLAIEIHRNVGGGKAEGFEFLCVSREGKSAARFFAASSAINYPQARVRRDGGALQLDKGGRGAGFCRAPRCPAIVLEPCFFDNRKDWPRIRDDVEKEARAYLAAAKAAFENGFENVPSLDEAKRLMLSQGTSRL